MKGEDRSEFDRFNDAMRRIIAVKPEQVKKAREKRKKHAPTKRARGKS